MEKVRWGLLSTARINRRVIPAIKQSERGQLTAVASRSQQAADDYARQWKIPHSFGSYEAMLSSDVIDAVYISLPNHLHAEWTINALRAGKHVLCEKPFAPTLEEVDRMYVTAQETGLALAEAFMYRYHPQSKLMGQWLADGRLGEVLLVNGIFNYDIWPQDRPYNIRLKPEFAGGCLWDVGVYPLSFAQFVMGGPPQWVAGSQWIGESGVDEDFAGQLYYGNGRVAHIASSFRSPFHTRIEIVGTRGRLVAERPFVHVHESQPVIYPAQGEPEVMAIPDEYLYLGEIEDMQAAILDGRSPVLAPVETRNHVRTALALYKAAREERVVRLAELS